ncbi:uncharacterized protein L201_003405 [Kwoniella dendrophila CBS 6074]|uniref:Mid2 domain-containing protein n=1 Tax=Kwoniella dendrophila CBS 6074 TaxID=1295534 RepID=A0AAX4JUL1_9TREE
MHLSTAVILLLPLALAHQGGPPTHPHRRHHSRAAVVDANRLIPRAGAAIDNGTLASISQHDAQASATQTSLSASTIATSTKDANDGDDAAVTSAVTSSAANSGKFGDGLPSTLSSSTTSSLVSSVTSTSDLATSTTDSAIASSTTSTSVAAIVTSTTQVAPVTLSQSTSAIEQSTTAHSTIVLVTTASKSQSTHKASSTAESAESEKKSSGLGKTALIAIIVVASVVGAAGIGWTLFRKWKLRPSNRFDKRMNPIDFSPDNGDMNDDFFEKTLQRTASNSSASRQRRELVAELDDPNAVPGVPTHDFTAGTAGVGAYAMYNQDPYSHAEQYDYEAAYNQPGQHGYDQNQHGYDQHQYPPQAMTQDHQGYAGYQGAPTQDTDASNAGYADLQRGNSIGSGSGHGHNHNGSHMHQHDQGVYPGELTFPSADQYGALGRPTGGAEGPYAQAAQYRGY